ncbi:Protein disulfide-isomerase LQY1, chloroplastic [Glycine max]|nr:Protein disulfide-isomerase LQY1, chloroplastic [Glycine max]
MTVLSPSLSLPKLHSSFLCCPLKSKLSSSATNRIQQKPTSYPRIRALDLDQNTVVAISVGLVSVAVGIGIPVFYETQIDNAVKSSLCCRLSETTRSPVSHAMDLALALQLQQVAFCGVVLARFLSIEKCRFCLGSGNVTVELGGGEKEVSRCINCDAVGSLTCTTCQGSGIQPRYLDRREFKDDD